MIILFRLKPVFLLFISLLVFISSCKKNPEETTITFNFEHTVDGNSVIFDDIIYHNDIGNIYSVVTLKYFISNIILHAEDGTEYSFDRAFYIDALEPSTLSFSGEELINSGDFTGISFVFGLDEEKNINGNFPNPPETYMEWPLPLGGGYHYMKLEGKVKNEEITNNFQAHFGPTDGDHYFIDISLNSSFSINKNKNVITISMDINKWWNGGNQLDLNEIQSVMANAEIQQKFKENGVDAFSFHVE